MPYPGQLQTAQTGQPRSVIVGEAVEGTGQKPESPPVPLPAPVRASEPQGHRAIALSHVGGATAALAPWGQVLVLAWLHCQLRWPR